MVIFEIAKYQISNDSSIFYISGWIWPIPLPILELRFRYKEIGFNFISLATYEWMTYEVLQLLMKSIRTNQSTVQFNSQIYDRIEVWSNTSSNHWKSWYDEDRNCYTSLHPLSQTKYGYFLRRNPST